MRTEQVFISLAVMSGKKTPVPHNKTWDNENSASCEMKNEQNEKRKKMTHRKYSNGNSQTGGMNEKNGKERHRLPSGMFMQFIIFFSFLIIRF